MPLRRATRHKLWRKKAQIPMQLTAVGSSWTTLASGTTSGTRLRPPTRSWPPQPPRAMHPPRAVLSAKSVLTRIPTNLMVMGVGSSSKMRIMTTIWSTKLTIQETTFCLKLSKKMVVQAVENILYKWLTQKMQVIQRHRKVRSNSLDLPIKLYWKNLRMGMVLNKQKRTVIINCRTCLLWRNC